MNYFLKTFFFVFFVSVASQAIFALPAHRGDVNGDAIISINDTVLLQRFVTGSDMTSTAWYNHVSTGDVNCDAGRSINDVVLSLRYVVGNSMN